MERNETEHPVYSRARIYIHIRIMYIHEESSRSRSRRREDYCSNLSNRYVESWHITADLKSDCLWQERGGGAPGIFNYPQNIADTRTKLVCSTHVLIIC